MGKIKSNSTQWNTAFGWGNHASQNYATATTDFRIVGGVVTSGGGVQSGSGFSVNRTGPGIYEITFSPNFTGDFFATANSVSGYTCEVVNWNLPVMQVLCKDLSTTFTVRDSYFTFIAIGSR